MSFTKVDVSGAFWGPRLETTRTVTLPVEYEQLEKVGALTAYQWEWNPDGKNRPWRIWVGDVAKWLEAASYTLSRNPDEGLARLAETAIENILKGQKEDGYLYSNPIAPDQRWTNLQEGHEHYDVGHAIEAAVAYYQATGKRELLDGLCRCADLLDANFGRQKGKRRGYDGHEEIELALVKLYRVTGRKRYLKLAKFFIDERGREPDYFVLEKEECKRRGIPMRGWMSDYSYVQAHRPVREQREAVGHSVRAMYLYSGMADVAAETGDGELLAACRRLWKSTTGRRMYIIGAVGSRPKVEAFTFDYDLPNETGYAETCANIALALFAHRMLQIDAHSEYADVMERALYNGVLSGLSLDGKTFFYANHLTVFPHGAPDPSDHVATARQEWFSCACCPPNIARTLAGLGRFVYSTGKSAIYVHLYVGGSAEAEVGGRKVVLRQQTDYPWKEKVRITLEPERAGTFTVALRIPGWCRKARVAVNGEAIDAAGKTRKGYACIRRRWEKGDRIDLTLPMPVERVEAHPSVRMDCGKVALQRGPVVYCLEEADNGKNLADIFLPRDSKLKAEYRPDLLGGAVVISGRAQRRDQSGWDGRLYRASRSRTKSVDILAVPYHLWGNRKGGEMLVWIRGG